MVFGLRWSWKKNMRVLSLFDGISCGYLAFQKADIAIDSYDAYEIEPNAIKTSKANFPKIMQHGDVTTEDFSKYKGKIDVLIGGSPCKGFSSLGKQLNFNDPQSKLFFEFVRALKEVQPKYFLLENVVMKQQWQDIITSYLNVKPIEINSALVSAQNRRRLYWTNIPFHNWPKSKHIVLQDILDKYPDKSLSVNLSNCVMTGIKLIEKKFGFVPQMFNPYNRQKITEKSPTLSTGSMITSSCATLRFEPCANGDFEVKDGYINIQGELYKTSLSNGRYYLRKLSINEGKRLQTLPENFIFPVGETQAFKLMGNGWTVDIISHILKGLKEDE